MSEDYTKVTGEYLRQLCTLPFNGNQFRLLMLCTDKWFSFGRKPFPLSISYIQKKLGVARATAVLLKKQLIEAKILILEESGRAAKKSSMFSLNELVQTYELVQVLELVEKQKATRKANLKITSSGVKTSSDTGTSSGTGTTTSSGTETTVHNTSITLHQNIPPIIPPEGEPTHEKPVKPKKPKATSSKPPSPVLQEAEYLAAIENRKLHHDLGKQLDLNTEIVKGYLIEIYDWCEDNRYKFKTFERCIRKWYQGDLGRRIDVAAKFKVKPDLLTYAAQFEHETKRKLGTPPPVSTPKPPPKTSEQLEQEKLEYKQRFRQSILDGVKEDGPSRRYWIRQAELNNIDITGLVPDEVIQKYEQDKQKQSIVGMQKIN